MADSAKELRISTRSRDELVDITAPVQEAVTESGVREGICHVYVPHTTAGVTINEGADPAVKRDIIAELDRLVSHDGRFAHAEGNSAAHVKATLVGSSQSIPLSGGKLLLGTWQSIYFCEFDGPRSRKTYVRIISG